MAADGLATRGARASATMIFTLLNRINSGLFLQVPRDMDSRVSFIKVGAVNMKTLTLSYPRSDYVTGINKCA